MSPETADTDLSSDDLNHYIRKSDITRSIVEGVAVPALCGDMDVVVARGNGSVKSSRGMACPLCQLVYEELRG
ncbi:DUF3039 domain-containing protein [Microbacterium sp. A204]|uniref:DUF3039 domain-containing protein n=1 Tax=Microbacterium sp. A204 TaxID=3457321 RepID=UPI003FD6624D